MASKRKVCIIGAGPCGTSALFHFDQISDSATEVVCYEKSDTWLGLWNFTWMTGNNLSRNISYFACSDYHPYQEKCHSNIRQLVSSTVLSFFSKIMLRFKQKKTQYDTNQF